MIKRIMRYITARSKDADVSLEVRLLKNHCLISIFIFVTLNGRPKLRLIITTHESLKNEVIKTEQKK